MPAEIQEALGELVGAAREGLLAGLGDYISADVRGRSRRPAPPRQIFQPAQARLSKNRVRHCEMTHGDSCTVRRSGHYVALARRGARSRISWS